MRYWSGLRARCLGYGLGRREGQAVGRYVEHGLSSWDWTNLGYRLGRSRYRLGRWGYLDKLVLDSDSRLELLHLQAHRASSAQIEFEGLQGGLWVGASARIAQPPRQHETRSATPQAKHTYRHMQTQTHTDRHGVPTPHTQRTQYSTTLSRVDSLSRAFASNGGGGSTPGPLSTRAASAAPPPLPPTAAPALLLFPSAVAH
eukprot:3653139-Rhodomonas_salina.1